MLINSHVKVYYTTNLIPHVKLSSNVIMLNYNIWRYWGNPVNKGCCYDMTALILQANRMELKQIKFHFERSKHFTNLYLGLILRYNITVYSKYIKRMMSSKMTSFFFIPIRGGVLFYFLNNILFNEFILNN